MPALGLPPGGNDRLARPPRRAPVGRLLARPGADPGSPLPAHPPSPARTVALRLRPAPHVVPLPLRPARGSMPSSCRRRCSTPQKKVVSDPTSVVSELVPGWHMSDIASCIRREPADRRCHQHQLSPPSRRLLASNRSYRRLGAGVLLAACGGVGCRRLVDFKKRRRPARGRPCDGIVPWPLGRWRPMDGYGKRRGLRCPMICPDGVSHTRPS